MNAHHRRRYRSGALALALCVSAASCGDDDETAVPATDAPAVTDASESTRPPETSPPETDASTDTTTSDTTAPAEAEPVDIEEFCSTVIAADAIASAGPQVDFATATNDEIGAAMEVFGEALIPLLDQLSVASPAEVADAVATIDSAVRESFETGDDPFADPVVLQADHTIDRYMAENCGYEMIMVDAVDYAFEGVPGELPTGTVGFEFDNQGTEVHEMIVMRINDDVDATVEELLQLPEEEAMSMTQYVGAAFAPPGKSDITFIDLVPGRYVMLCFIPVGTVNIGDGPPPEGPPHVMHGMVHAFTVA